MHAIEHATEREDKTVPERTRGAIERHSRAVFPQSRKSRARPIRSSVGAEAEKSNEAESAPDKNDISPPWHASPELNRVAINAPGAFDFSVERTVTIVDVSTHHRVAKLDNRARGSDTEIRVREFRPFITGNLYTLRIYHAIDLASSSFLRFFRAREISCNSRENERAPIRPADTHDIVRR